MALYPPSAVERAMKIQEVILRAHSGQISWIQAAHVLGISPRTMRRWKWRYEHYGYDGLFDRRRQRPSPKRVPVEELERILRLYRERYQGFSARHFHQFAVRHHGVTLSYTYVKQALQTAGLIAKRKHRGRHRRRRQRKPCFGEMLHLDGSTHQWLSLRPGKQQTMVAVVDDATSRLLDARLEQAEDVWAILRALRSVFETHGLPMSLNTDRASWAFHTPRAGGKVDRERLTQVGRALAELGVEHIPSYSPQARGRSERLNRTLQERLVPELAAAGIDTIEAANRYLEQCYIPLHNELFAVEPKEPENLFVACPGVHLDNYLCIKHQRVVGQDNVVHYRGMALQIDKQRDRATCAKLRVSVREHLDGRISVWHGQKCLGTFAVPERKRQPRERAA
ncbi:MAG: ISNCY family transposase [Candidatus Dadabacteria bacterium]|nr:MAG: ISNCY family transposase [Candidatus Dadabacteria bacterium]